MKKEKKKHLIRGSIQYDRKPIKKEWLVEKVPSKKFKQLLENSGVYILYKKRRKKYDIVYVGIAGFGNYKTLFSRLRDHLRDHLKRKWDYFTAFTIPVSEKKKRYLKDIEGLLIRATEPPENKNTPIILEERNYQRTIKKIMREQVKSIKGIRKNLKKEEKLEQKEVKKKFKEIQKQHKQEEEKYKNLLEY